MQSLFAVYPPVDDDAGRMQDARTDCFSTRRTPCLADLHWASSVDGDANVTFIQSIGSDRQDADIDGSGDVDPDDVVAFFVHSDFGR